jgi:hypothetical protein
LSSVASSDQAPSICWQCEHQGAKMSSSHTPVAVAVSKFSSAGREGRQRARERSLTLRLRDAAQS